MLFFVNEQLNFHSPLLVLSWYLFWLHNQEENISKVSNDVVTKVLEHCKISPNLSCLWELPISRASHLIFSITCFGIDLRKKRDICTSTMVQMATVQVSFTYLFICIYCMQQWNTRKIFQFIPKSGQSSKFKLSNWPLIYVFDNKTEGWFHEKMDGRIPQVHDRFLFQPTLSILLIEIVGKTIKINLTATP